MYNIKYYSDCVKITPGTDKNIAVKNNQIMVYK